MLRVLRLRTCSRCYALVRATHVGLHESWHDHILRLIAQGIGVQEVPEYDGERLER